MENKYFTPDIDDIHIGYELEVNYNFKLNDIFHKKIIESFEELSDIHSRMPGDCVIRIPYLTKEQIEAEGWIKAKAPIVTINHDFYEIPYIKDNFRVDYNFRNNLINIIENNGKNLFYGKCKDINTFRKLIKLLGI
jgi:hypothetical protein